MEKTMVSLRLLVKLPSPYNDFLFRNLHGSENVDLSVHYLWRQSWRHPWTTQLAAGYPHVYLKRFLGVDWSLVKAALKERDSFFLVADWAHIAFIIVLLIRIVMNTPVGIWADTPQEHLPRRWPKRVLRRKFLSWFLRQVDVVFATGKPAIRELGKMGVPGERLVNLPYYVDIRCPETLQNSASIRVKRKYFREMVNCDDEACIFLMAGTCENRKRQDIGLRAFAQCYSEARDKVGMIIAGDGPNLERLVKMAQELGISDRVAFVGWLNPGEMEAAYAACDVVLHTPLVDPFPLVVLEGMNWGKVVIGSDVCGSAEDRITHGVNGFVFPSGNIDALTGIMKEIVFQPERRRQIGLAARTTAEEWPVERGVETIVETARQVLAGHT